MQSRQFTGPRSRREKGNIVMELALAMPLFLLIIAGSLDLGMLFYSKHVITNASREGARAAAKAVDNGTNVMAQKTQSQIRQIVQDYVTQFSITALDGSPLVLNSTTFDYNWTTTSSGTVLTINLNQIPYRMMLLPNVKTFFGGTRTEGDDAFYMSAQTSMAAEWTTPPSP